jgi:hypothetical protein
MTSVPNQWLTLRLARSNRVIDAVVTSTVISDKRVGIYKVVSIAGKDECGFQWRGWSLG